MNWEAMHIGIDLGLRLINSNLYNQLQKEEKDYLLNKSVHTLISDEVDSITKGGQVVSYDQIRTSYKIIQPLLRSLSTKSFITGEKYIDIDLPEGTTTPIMSGVLKAGVSYKFLVSGATNLTTFGAANNNPNSSFTYNPIDVGFESDGGGGFQLDIIEGYTYEILRTDGISFTTYGAVNNNVGTVFTANASHSYASATQDEALLRVISGLPTWDGVTKVVSLKSYDVYSYLSSRSLIDMNCTLGSGVLTKGKFYKVAVAGTIDNLNTFGSAYTTVEVGYTFLCTKDGIPNWAASGVQLKEHIESVNRLVVITDLDNMLNHSYGTVHSSPICVLVDGKLRIYHNNKFDISRVTIDYVTNPAAIDYKTNTDCDLNLSVHDKVVDKTVEYISATYASPAYQHIKNEGKQ